MIRVDISVAHWGYKRRATNLVATLLVQQVWESPLWVPILFDLVWFDADGIPESTIW